MPAAASWPVEHLSQAGGCYIPFSALSSCHDFDERKLLLLKPGRDGRFILNSTTGNSNQKSHPLSEPECLRLIMSNILVRSNWLYWPAYLSYGTSTKHSGSKQRTPPCGKRVTYAIKSCLCYSRLMINTSILDYSGTSVCPRMCTNPVKVKRSSDTSSAEIDEALQVDVRTHLSLSKFLICSLPCKFSILSRPMDIYKKILERNDL